MTSSSPNVFRLRILALDLCTVVLLFARYKRGVEMQHPLYRKLSELNSMYAGRQKYTFLESQTRANVYLRFSLSPSSTLDQMEINNYLTNYNKIFWLKLEMCRGSKQK